VSLDEQARALLISVMTPQRRARPRMAQAFRDVQQHEIETPLGAVAAWRLGEGPAVLCVHGWQDDSALWSPLAAALAEAGIAVVAFDLPGHGFSQGDRCTPIGAAAAIRAVAEALGPIDAVVTHSFGAPATAVAMTRGFDVRRAVLIGAPRGRNLRWKRIAQEQGLGEEVVERAREIYSEEVGEKLSSFDLIAVAPSFKAEALVIHSLDDDAVEWDDNGQAIANAWPGAEFLLCDGLGHRKVAQDREIIARIVSFVS